VHVKPLLFPALALMSLLIGCGMSAREREAFPLVDRDATKRAFIAAVREHYATRTRRGTLSEPLIDDDRVKFVFHYKKPRFGIYAERVQLDLYAGEPGENGATAGPHYLVGAWYPRQGSDAEAAEVRAHIVERMNQRPGASPIPE
jgi:hypothetical protein